MFSIADLDLKRQIELTGGEVDKETADQLEAVGLEATPDMAKKYAKIDYGAYRYPRYIDNAPMEKAVMNDFFIGVTATPLTTESFHATPVKPAAPTIGESTILELIDLIETSELNSAKAIKVLKMSVKDLFKKQNLDTEFVQNLIELSK